MKLGILYKYFRTNTLGDKTTVIVFTDNSTKIIIHKTN